MKQIKGLTKPRRNDHSVLMFPISISKPSQFPGNPPAQCDIAIIGCGIVGVMTAWYLAKAGHKVAICEKGRIAGEQSSRNWGWIRQQGRDPAELPIMIEASRIWQTLSKECGEDLGFQRKGVLYLANNANDMANFELWLEHAKQHQLDTRLLNRKEVSDLVPSHKVDWPGGMITPSDGRAEPWVAVPALARAAVRMGVTIVEDCAVRTLDIAGGKIAGVVTERGRIACEQVVVAGGAWSSLFLRNHGILIPQLSVRSTVAATEPMAEVFAGNAADNNFAFRRRVDGGYSLALGSDHDFYVGPDAFRHIKQYVTQLKKDPFASRYRPFAPKHFPDSWTTKRKWSADERSPFENMRILDPAPNLADVKAMQRYFAAAFPHLGEPKIKTAWAGMIDTMPDIVPIIDHAPGLAGLTIATGMCGHGFGIGPGIGRVVADLVQGRPTGHDLTRFRFGRFTDGSKIELGPSL
ncbi:MAG: NAD(P)/FAD-dependent oxidoreductase [Rhizobiaceae bacterium]